MTCRWSLCMLGSAWNPRWSPATGLLSLPQRSWPADAAPPKATDGSGSTKRSEKNVTWNSKTLETEAQSLRTWKMLGMSSMVAPSSDAAPWETCLLWPLRFLTKWSNFLVSRYLWLVHLTRTSQMLLPDLLWIAATAWLLSISVSVFAQKQIFSLFILLLYISLLFCHLFIC